MIDMTMHYIVDLPANFLLRAEAKAEELVVRPSPRGRGLPIL
jgi:regulator of sirC expression with transglutaminase-like and TPR domain